MIKIIDDLLRVMLTDFVWLSLLTGGLTYLYYRKFLAGNRRHGLNRLVLLSATFAPFLILIVQYFLPVPRLNELFHIPLEQITISGRAQVAAPHSDLAAILSMFLGVFFLVICYGGWRLFRNLVRMYRLTQDSDRIWENGICYVEAPEGMPVGSFWRYVFWREPEGINPEMRAQLRAHEECHVRLGHSYDLIWMDLMLICFWYNPFMYFIRRELRQIHEFQADEAALKVGSEQSYRALLAHQALKGKAPALVHTFHSNPIQKRISMMKKMQQPRGGIRQYLLLLPLTLLLFGMPVVNAQVGGSKPDSEKVNYDQDIRLLNINEVMKLIGYPKAAEAAGIEGKVIAKIRFDESGRYLDHSWVMAEETQFRDAVNAHISKLRIEPVTLKGKPTKCEVTLPFAFKLP